MKIITLAGLLAFSMLLNGCRPENSDPPSLLGVISIQDSAQSRFIQYANQTNGDPFEAMGLTTAWLNTQTDVANAETPDSVYIYINLKSGLATTIYLDLVDDNGNSYYRGGGNPANQVDPDLTCEKPTKNTIKNKKVLLFAADIASLASAVAQIPKSVQRLNNSGLDLEVTVLMMEQCSYGVVEHFGDYGLVIIDTHGDICGFNIGSKLDFANTVKTDAAIKADILKQLDGGAYAKFMTAELKMVMGLKVNPNKKDWPKSMIPNENRRIEFTSDYLNMLPPMPNTIIVGNFCRSGNSFASQGRMGIRTAFLNRKPISYYCYVRADNAEMGSWGVRDPFAALMEDLFIKRLAEEAECTGFAHRRPSDGAQYYDTVLARFTPSSRHWKELMLMFKQYGDEEYSYNRCGDTLTDARDKQKYATVCIGKQNWMAQNLNYIAPGSITYDNNPANGPIYGRLYDLKTIMQGANSSEANPSGVRGICPEGWHVPSKAEYITLFEEVGFSTAGGALKATVLWDAPNTGATNSSGFTGLPGGYASDIDNSESSLNLGKWGYFATTSKQDGRWEIYLLVHDGADVQGTNVSFEKQGVSCRCLKD